MLEILRIRNIAIIDSAEVRFKRGLNILSGETGAGKSIVIEAISLLLGSRATSELIRSGCDEAVIEGLFDISEIPWMALRLQQFGFEGQTQDLLIKRSVHRAGRHRISVNGELATLSTLQALCEGLIDLCGQNEHQSLVKPLLQLELLDRFGGLLDQSKNLASLLVRFRTLMKERDQLRREDHESAKRTDFLKFQIEEIRAAELVLGEEEDLQQQKQILQSAAHRAQMSESICEVLEADEGGALNILRTALQKLRTLHSLDSQVHSISESMERALIETEDTGVALRRYIQSVDLDSERLHGVQERLSVLADLKRKYGSHVSDILETLAQLEVELGSIGQANKRLDLLCHDLETLEGVLNEHGKKISSARRNVSEILGVSVTEELKDLKMGEAKFLVEISHRDPVSEWNMSGPDCVQFVVQTNRGEPARALGKIASGGELSRLMLAIRRVIADRGGIGVYLFDEIDAGIGGQAAFQVGKKLKSVAAYNQVICITHLPQVASFAEHHLIVRKRISGSRTLTEVVELTSEEQKVELARMLGGAELTSKSLANAAELLELARAV